MPREATWRDMRQTFHYVFADKPRTGGGVPEIVAHVIDGPLAVGGMRIVPVPLWHGQMPVLGFRTGGFAYLTDCNRLDDAAWPLLDGRGHAGAGRAARQAALHAFHRARSAGGGERAWRPAAPT